MTAAMTMGRKTAASLAAAVIWLMIGLLTVLFTFAIILSVVCFGWLDRRRRLAHWLAMQWGQSIFLCNPLWKLSVAGRRQVRTDQRYILVANHQSMLDIMAGFCVQRQFKWVAKTELFAIPFLGWSMSLAKYVKLARGERGSIRETYEQAKRWLGEGVSVFFFPEGTRSQTGEVGAFRNGAFKLAIATGTPVVPVAIHGTRDLLVKGSWLLQPGVRVRVTVLPPIDPAAYAGDFGRLRDDARGRILQALAR